MRMVLVRVQPPQPNFFPNFMCYFALVRRLQGDPQGRLNAVRRAKA